MPTLFQTMKSEAINFAFINHEGNPLLIILYVVNFTKNSIQYNSKNSEQGKEMEGVKIPEKLLIIVFFGAPQVFPKEFKPMIFPKFSERLAFRAHPIVPFLHFLTMKIRF